MITYNHRPYIEQAVKCVLDQETDFSVELVIGEDCSTDGTRELVFDLQRRHPEHIRVITSEHNVGAHKNLFRTETACRGKYIAYCEGDDYWNDPLKLAKQVAFLEARPDYSMVHSHAHRYFVAEKRLGKDMTVTRGLDEAKAFEDMVLDRRPALTVTVLARADKLKWILDHCPECTDPKWPMGDTQRFLELSKLGKVGCIHEPFATTNYLLESASQSRNVRERLRFIMAARELKLHYLRKYPVPTEVERSVREKLALIALYHAYQARDTSLAEALYMEYRNACLEKPGLRAGWLRWGSRSALHQRLVMPLVMAEERWRRLQERRANACNQRMPA